MRAALLMASHKSDELEYPRPPGHDDEPPRLMLSVLAGLLLLLLLPRSTAMGTIVHPRVPQRQGPWR